MEGWTGYGHAVHRAVPWPLANDPEKIGYVRYCGNRR